MTIAIEKFILGPIETNAYLVVNEQNRAFLVDPSDNPSEVVNFINTNKIVLESIIITHGHFDHIMGIPEIIESYPDVKVYVSSGEKIMLKEPQYNGSFMIGLPFTYDGVVHELNEGEMTIGSFNVNVIFVPGHSPAGTAILIGNYLLCGDILFAGSIGRADLLGGNEELLVNGIKSKLMVLPDDTVVCPGHGGRTTIARERKANPYI
jgi:glyoxylase-like metal-dependent hydrolase (beta-lactamase superfamily II)